METINWDAVSASAEVIGVMAVLASILYLGRQVAQGNKLNQADSVRAFLGQYNTLLYKINEPDMVEIWRRGLADFESLNGEEKSRLHFVLLSHFMLGQAQRMVDPEGSEPLSKTVDLFIAATVKQGGFQQWWDTFKGLIPDEVYTNRIDNLPAAKDISFAESMPWFIDGLK